MPDFDRVARFKRRTQDAEAVWVASELEKAWTYGCDALVVSELKPLKRSTGKLGDGGVMRPSQKKGKDS